MTNEALKTTTTCDCGRLKYIDNQFCDDCFPKTKPPGTTRAILETPPAVALKFDTDKPRMELLDQYALEQIALVMTFGAKKYDSWNWKNGFKWGRLIGAALRHIGAFARGEDTDPESGLPHLAHAGCCIMFLLWHSKYKQDLDDRYKEQI